MKIHDFLGGSEKKYRVTGRKVDGGGKLTHLQCVLNGVESIISVDDVAEGILLHGETYSVKGSGGILSDISIRLVTNMDGDESDNISGLPTV